MTTPVDLPVGSFFLRHFDGLIGRGITAMQAFVRGGSFWTHAGMILDNGEFIQGQPRGAKIYPISDLWADGSPLLVSDAPIQVAMAALQASLVGAVRPDGQLHDAETCQSCSIVESDLRGRVATAGRALDGASYSYLDYPVLGLAELARTHPQNKQLNSVSVGLRNYINKRGHLICSALVDRAYQNGGVNLFADDRMPGDVTPEDLAEYAYADGREPLIDTREKKS